MDLKDLISMITIDFILESIATIAIIGILWGLFFQGGLQTIIDIIGTSFCG